MSHPLESPRPAASADHSRFVQRVRRRYADRLDHLPPGPPTHETIAAALDRLRAEGLPLAQALRVTRAIVMERLAVLDIEDGASVKTVTHGMTALAEVALQRALQHARAELDALHGEVRTAEGQPVAFWIVGMGKLGGRELNVSSDIDLIYVYEDDGHTTGGSHPGGSISAHEYFAKLARALYALVGDTTEDGFVFRMDLALRPHGNSGPPAVSLDMLEDYLLVQGREWERFAWLKSRVVAPRVVEGDTGVLQVRDLVVPFVFRRYLDYSVFEALRQLHRKIRDEAQRRAAGRPERANDVKLSRGGIREIEFTVQLLQVVRGGHFPEIRTRSTLRALDRLAGAGLMSPQAAVRLADAYVFLRRVEHRIQFLDDQQTHLLPTQDDDLRWLAQAMGYEGEDPVAAFLDELLSHRETVASEFDALLHDGRPQGAGPAPGGAGNGNGCKTCGGPPPPIDSAAFLACLPPALTERVQAFAAQTRVQALKEEARQRLAGLIGRAVRLAPRATPESEPDFTAVQRFVDWLEPLLRRESYLALLVERPEVHKRLLRLLGLARWPMRYLMQHPGVIDELADARLLHERFARQELLQELTDRHAAWVRSGEADEEALLDTLRRAHHAEVFRTLVRDLEGDLDVEQVADELSAQADAILDCTVRWAWMHLRNRHRDAPRFAVIAYGKLGGKELGYGSDLDVVFLFDDEDERASEIYAAFARKFITWLTLRTRAGELFDIDTALRPNGNSGLLVTRIEAFESYQTQRGSNTAWTWEHQAITRARWCAGDPGLAERFEATRRAVLCAPRDARALAQEITGMRQRVREAHPVRATRFDLKHSPGGMIDVEFAVQYLVLMHSAQHPTLQDNAGNIALLQRAEDAGLLPAGLGAAAARAYREMRRAQHRARLDEASTQMDAEALGDLAPHREAVRALWNQVFGAHT